MHCPQNNKCPVLGHVRCTGSMWLFAGGWLTKVQAWSIGAPQQPVRVATLELGQGHQLLGWEGVQDRGLPLLGSPCIGRPIGVIKSCWLAQPRFQCSANHAELLSWRDGAVVEDLSVCCAAGRENARLTQEVCGSTQHHQTYKNRRTGSQTACIAQQRKLAVKILAPMG